MTGILQAVLDFFEPPKEVQNFKSLMHIKVATLFGLGFAKKAPGTIASFVTLVVSFIIASITPYLLVVAAAVVALIAMWSISQTNQSFQLQNINGELKDPSFVVIDEVAGQMIPLLVAGTSVPSYIVAFILFRFFDITKVSLVGSAERSFGLNGAILADDVVAGCFALFGVSILMLFGIL